MKAILAGLVASTLIATPVLASWKTEFFSRIDADKSGELTVAELSTAGCRVKAKLFRYADADRSAGLSRDEYFTNRDLFGRCK
jgi:hypothetical protein